MIGSFPALSPRASSPLSSFPGLDISKQDCSCSTTFRDARRPTSSSVPPTPSRAERQPRAFDRDQYTSPPDCSCSTTYRGARRPTSSSMPPTPSHAERRPPSFDREQHMSTRGCSCSTTYEDA